MAIIIALKFFFGRRDLMELFQIGNNSWSSSKSDFTIELAKKLYIEEDRECNMNCNEQEDRPINVRPMAMCVHGRTLRMASSVFWPMLSKTGSEGINIPPNYR